ncbi:hypothetical protein [Gryllotalpicola kribbensis]|uniref:hypothetical protein n=1 Tax=Gryllotalpicola kribbensis TaxID=993084 RepID=UPI0031DBD14D
MTGLAVGYVLGARAGRKRYEQIASAANKVWQSPGIQKQVHAAQDFAAAKIGDIPGAVFDGVRKVTNVAIDRAQTKATGKVPSPSSSSRAAGAPATQAARTAAARAASGESDAELRSTAEPLD